MKSRWEPGFDFADEVPSGNPTSSIRYGQLAPITTAALRSINSFQYGYMEMRAQAAKGPISSSYWTTGPGGETDAFENFGYNPNNQWAERRVHTSFHDWRSGSPTYGKRIWDNAHILEKGNGVADGFHTYGFEWDPNYIAIYVDGGLVNCTTRAEMGSKWVANNAHKVWIDSETFDWEVRPENLEESHFGGADGIDFVVDYARVYQRSNGVSGPGCPARNNLVENPGFENGKAEWVGDGIVNGESNSGSGGLTLSSRGTVEQVITVEPNTTYVLSAFVTSPDTNERNIWENAYLGVRGHGGSENNARFFFPRWNHKSVQFTTGPSNTEATIYFTNNPQGGRARIDDVLVTKLLPTP
ncbi:family 16 glycosylhydrolase [Pseudoalteromonas sp. B129b]